LAPASCARRRQSPPELSTTTIYRTSINVALLTLVQQIIDQCYVPGHRIGFLFFPTFAGHYIRAICPVGKFGERDCRTTGDITEGVKEWKSKIRVENSSKFFTLMLGFWLFEIPFVVVESCRSLAIDSMAKTF
jgi:hypothetical protein